MKSRNRPLEQNGKSNFQGHIGSLTASGEFQVTDSQNESHYRTI